LTKKATNCGYVFPPLLGALRQFVSKVNLIVKVYLKAIVSIFLICNSGWYRSPSSYKEKTIYLSLIGFGSFTYAFYNARLYYAFSTPNVPLKTLDHVVSFNSKILGDMRSRTVEFFVQVKRDETRWMIIFKR